METVLGLIGMAVFIVCVIALAAAVTALVVKISPTKTKPDPKAPAAS
jgi:hypothetical protein